MIAWKEDDSESPLTKRHTLNVVKLMWNNGLLTISTFQAGEPAFREGRQTETLQVKLSVAVTFTHHQTLSIHLTDLHTHADG